MPATNFFHPAIGVALLGVALLICKPCATALGAAGGGSDAAAIAPDRSTAWKLTVGEYAYSGYAGSDLNLRWRSDDLSAWVGAYSDRVFGTQFRAGTDTSFQIFKYLQLLPSLQLASRGFAGASLNAQVGGDCYGIAGFGRTDGRPYFNLNFDPNDAVTFGAGCKSDGGIAATVLLIADDRFHSGQRDWHANVQIPFGASHATIDLLRKSGLSDAGRISAWGLSANWDWPRIFLRIAYDPYQNFSSQDAWRLASGIRF